MTRLFFSALTFGLLAFAGCPSAGDDDVSDDDSGDDDVGDDDAGDDDVAQDVLTVTGGESCGALASVYWMLVGESASYIVASTVDDHCTKFWSAHADYGDPVLESLWAAYDAAYAAQDGPGSCDAMVAYQQHLLPTQEAVYPPGSCTLMTVSVGLSETAPPETLYLYFGSRDWSEWLASTYGDCSQVQTWEDYLAIDAGYTSGYPTQTWILAEGEVSVQDLGENTWGAHASGLVLRQTTYGPEVTVDFDLTAPVCAEG